MSTWDMGRDSLQGVDIQMYRDYIGNANVAPTLGSNPESNDLEATQIWT